MRDQVILACSACKSRNYSASRNKKRQKSKLALEKYCPRCRKHTEHKEEGRRGAAAGRGSQACSSNGRAADSKSVGWGFKSLQACTLKGGMKERIKAYLGDVRAELARVSWTPRELLRRTTIVLLVLMLIMAAFFGVVDILFSNLVNKVFFRQGF